MIRIIMVMIGTCFTFGVLAQEPPTTKKIEVSRLQKKLNRNIQLVDVRTPKEYNEEHIGNAMNIDFTSTDFEANVQKLNKNKRVYLYCRTGNRSAKAAKKMKEMGFHKLYVLHVGIEGWKKEISN